MSLIIQILKDLAVNILADLVLEGVKKAVSKLKY